MYDDVVDEIAAAVSAERESSQPLVSALQNICGLLTQWENHGLNNGGQSMLRMVRDALDKYQERSNQPLQPQRLHTNNSDMQGSNVTTERGIKNGM
jgi:hypothetical protein